jgi:hypothetical protein
MSVTYTSNVVFGVRINAPAFLADKKVRSCDHGVSGEPKFCPECGKPFHQKLSIGHFEEELEETTNLRFFGNTHSDDCNSLVVGIMISSSGEGDEPQTFDFPSEETRAQVFEGLKTHGFAENISQLRLFNILYCG